MSEYRDSLATLMVEEFQETREEIAFTETSKAIDFIRRFSPKRKDYYYSFDTIFSKHFNLSLDKFTSNTRLDYFIYSTKNYKYIKEIKNPKVELFKLEEKNLYPLLGRSLSDSKGYSCLYPILNFVEMNKLDDSIPIWLDLKYHSIIVYDYGYFKILRPTGDGTHRTVGLCESIGLLNDCSIETYNFNYKKIYAKKTIDDFIETVKFINDSKLIKCIEIISSGASSILFTLNNGNMIKMCFIGIDALYNFFLKQEFINVISNLLPLNIKNIEISDNSFSFCNKNTDRYLMSSYSFRRYDPGIIKISKKVNLLFRAHNKFITKNRINYKKHIYSVYGLKNLIRDYAFFKDKKIKKIKRNKRIIKLAKVNYLILLSIIAFLIYILINYFNPTTELIFFINDLFNIKNKNLLY